MNRNVIYFWTKLVSNYLFGVYQRFSYTNYWNTFNEFVTAVYCSSYIQGLGSVKEFLIEAADYRL